MFRETEKSKIKVSGDSVSGESKIKILSDSVSFADGHPLLVSSHDTEWASSLPLLVRTLISSWGFHS